MNDDVETATAEAPERAQVHASRAREQIRRDLQELEQQRGRHRFCAADALCVREAVIWKRSSSGQWIGRCRIHGARTPLEHRQAQLDEARRG